MKWSRISPLVLVLVVLLALPYFRFQVDHPDAMTSQLRILNSYWLQNIPLQDKLEQLLSAEERAELDRTGYQSLSSEEEKRKALKGCLSRNTTVYGSGASMCSTFSYQSLRGFTRSLASASGAPRTMSNVYFTSLEVKGWPSCHRTSRRRKNTRFR